MLFGVCDGVYLGCGCCVVHERACVLFACFVRPLLTRNALARRCGYRRVLVRKFPCVLCLVQLRRVACLVWCVRWCVLGRGFCFDHERACVLFCVFCAALTLTQRPRTSLWLSSRFSV